MFSLNTKHHRCLSLEYFRIFCIYRSSVGISFRVSVLSLCPMLYVSSKILHLCFSYLLDVSTSMNLFIVLITVFILEQFYLKFQPFFLFRNARKYGAKVFNCSFLSYAANASGTSWKFFLYLIILSVF